MLLSSVKALQAPLIESKGRMFPIETIYADHDIDRYQVAQEMAATICQAFRNQEGDILAFLPGQGEIMKCEEQLRSVPPSATLYPLYGNLSPKAAARTSLLPNRVNGKSYCASSYRRNFSHHRRSKNRCGFRTLPKTGL